MLPEIDHGEEVDVVGARGSTKAVAVLASHLHEVDAAQVEHLGGGAIGHESIEFGLRWLQWRGHVFGARPGAYQGAADLESPQGKP